MHHFVIFKTNFWQVVRHLQLRVLYSHKARICDQTKCALFLDFIERVCLSDDHVTYGFDQIPPSASSTRDLHTECMVAISHKTTPKDHLRNKVQYDENI